MESELHSALFGFAYVVMGAVVLILAKLIKDFLTPYKIDVELTARDNPALGLALTGYFAGVIIIFLGATVGPDPLEQPTAREILQTMGVDLLWALGGIVILNITRVVVDRLLLPKFSTAKEIIEDRNLGTGAVECGCFIATALIVAGAIHGEGGILSAVVFFLLGQIALVIFGLFYQLITRYDIHAEIERDNTAAGVAFGLSIVAIGVLLLRATRGDLVDWQTSLWDFGYYALLGFVLLLVLRKYTDAILLPGTTIRHEIAVDRNVNAALVEGVVAVGMASIIFFVL